HPGGPPVRAVPADQAGGRGPFRGAPRLLGKPDAGGSEESRCRPGLTKQSSRDLMAERRSRVRRWQLVTRFAAASLVVFVVIGAGLSILISRQLVRRERQNAESHAEFVTKSILRSELSPQDLSFLSPMGGQRYQEMLAFVQGRILQYPLVMVQIWRSDGTVV